MIDGTSLPVAKEKSLLLVPSKSFLTKNPRAESGCHLPGRPARIVKPEAMRLASLEMPP